MSTPPRPRFLWTTRTGAAMLALWFLTLGAYQGETLGPAPAWLPAIGMLGAALWLGGRLARWLLR